jgi:hypothetical protein
MNETETNNEHSEEAKPDIERRQLSIMTSTVIGIRDLLVKSELFTPDEAAGIIKHTAEIQKIVESKVEEILNNDEKENS